MAKDIRKPNREGYFKVKTLPEHPIIPVMTQGYSLLGLTKREYFAALMLQSFILHPNSGHRRVEDTVRSAVNFADFLISELNGELKNE